jgi:hypothetical protein
MLCKNRKGEKKMHRKIWIETSTTIALLWISLLTLAISVRPAKASGSLVGYWKFDEGSGTTAYDSSGNGNHGTIYGATYVDGKIGKALGFDGVDDNVEVPDSDTLDVTDALTVSFWFKSDYDIYAGFPEAYLFVGKWHGIGDQARTGFLVNLNLYSDGHMRLWLGFGNWEMNVLSSSKVTWSAGVWYHVAATYDRFLPNGNAKLYIDGVLDAQLDEHRTIAPNTLSLFINIDPFEFWHPWNTYFPGIMDDVRVYDSALSADEIGTIMNPSSGSYVRTYVSNQWVSGGTPMGWHADDASWQYELPFDFPFYGTPHRTIYISSNGLITFAGPDSSYGNSLEGLAGKLAIAPAWDDWVIDALYDVYIWQPDSSHITIRWEVRAYGSSVVANFEAILATDGVIQFNYGYNDGPVSATIGISNGLDEVLAEEATALNYIHSVIFSPFKIEPKIGLVKTRVYENPVPLGYGRIKFEEGVDGNVIKSTLPGLNFTTTLGYDWVYLDVRTGKYNAQSLTNPSVNFGSYVVNGYICAWLGPNMGQGRIDFINGTASYFSVLTSTYSGLCLDAYDSFGYKIATSGNASGNLGTCTFTRLTVNASGMAYVIIHDTGNYWEIDDVVTDAPGVPKQAGVIIGQYHNSAIYFHDVEPIAEYISENPKRRIDGKLDFVHSSIRDWPLIVYRRGERFQITSERKDDKITITMPEIHHPGVLKRLDDRTWEIEIQANKPIGGYAFDIYFDRYPYDKNDHGEDDQGVGRFFVIFNAKPKSPDGDVEGLSEVEFQTYVMSECGKNYYGLTTQSYSPGNKEDDKLPYRGWRAGEWGGSYRWFGGEVEWTLRPQIASVFLKALEFVNDKTSAEEVADILTEVVGSSILRCEWDNLTKGSLVNCGNVEYILYELNRTGRKQYGQCVTCAAILCGLARSVGIPNRMVTNVNSILKEGDKTTTEPWNFHVWNEVWLSKAGEKDWFAHDSTNGTKKGRDDRLIYLSIIKPTRRNSPDFQKRMGIFGTPQDQSFYETKAFTYDAKSDSRIDVTKKYEDPLSDPTINTGSENISIFTSSYNYTYGDNIEVVLWVINNRNYSISAPLNFTMELGEWNDLPLIGPFTAFANSETIIVGSHSATRRIYNISRSDYLYDGNFVMRAAIQTEDVEANSRKITIHSGLKSELVTPTRVLLNNTFSINATITNRTPATIHDVLVNASIPDYLHPLEPTGFIILSMSPNQSVTHTIHACSSLEGIEALSVVAYSEQAGSTVAHATTQILDGYDLAVANIVCPNDVVGQNLTLPINATILNQGYFTANFCISLYVGKNATSMGDETLIERRSVFSLDSGKSTTLTFGWSTIGFTKGNYTIIIHVTPVPNEADVADNILINGPIHVGIPGDVNGDRKVDLRDVYEVGRAFGSTYNATDEEYWHTPPRTCCSHNPNCDINCDRKIDLWDYYTTCRNYGKREP